MANSNRTEIYIEGSKAAIDNFVKRFEKCHSGPYPNQEDNPHIVDEFGADAELFIDKVGSKWVEIFDEGYYHSNDNRCEVYLDSAWYPPSDMILEIYRQMATIDSEIKVSGKYWDEAYQPIGVFEVFKGQIITEEIEIDEDEDQEYFWDDIIEPAFDKLQNTLDTVIESM